MKLQIRPLHRLVFTALLAAMATLLMVTINVPIIPAAAYLKADPSGAVILLGGLLLGPMGALECALLKSLLYFLVHGGSLYGIFSDLIATLTFTVMASWTAGRLHHVSLPRLIACCLEGCCAATLLMIPANYGILALQFGMSPQAVTASMIYIIPYNLLKTLGNSAVALAIFPAVYNALSKRIPQIQERSS